VRKPAFGHGLGELAASLRGGRGVVEEQAFDHLVRNVQRLLEKCGRGVGLGPCSGEASLGEAAKNTGFILD